MKIDEIVRQRDAARLLVLEMYVASCRKGWEEGPTEQEIFSSASDALFNWNMDPANNLARVEKLLGYKIDS